MSAERERRAVWTGVVILARGGRGFDDSRCWWPAFRLPGLAPDAARRSLSREPLPEDVRGSFQAIANLAAWTALTMPIADEMLDDPECVIRLRVAAADLEDMARGLRRALDEQLGVPGEEDLS